MKRIAALLVLFVAGLAAATLFTQAAVAHNGQISISCEEVTFNFSSFPTGPSTINWTVTVDGKPSTGTFSIGQSATETVPLHLASGRHHISASATWTVDGGGSTSFEADLHCGSTTTTTTEHPPPPPPTITVTTTVTSPPPPPVTNIVTTTVTQPAATVTQPAKIVIKYRTRTIVKYKTRVKVIHSKCSCAPGTRLWHGKCHAIVTGSG